jgi:hypothetical protein
MENGFIFTPQSPAQLMQKLGANYLRALLVQYPTATLEDYCRLVQRERGIQISTHTMGTLLILIGLSQAGTNQLLR